MFLIKVKSFDSLNFDEIPLKFVPLIYS